MATDDFSYDNLKNLKYLECVQKETTRFFGPAYGLFVREASHDHFLGSVPIKKGNLLETSVAIHFCPKYYKDPLVYRPERWEKECADLPPFVHMGFSAGQRSCIGKQLALLDSKIAVVKYLKRYSKIIVPDKKLRTEIHLSIEL